MEITYGSLNNAAKDLKKAADYLDRFSGELTNKVLNKLTGLPGSDSKGFVSSATTQVSAKKTKIEKKASGYRSLGNAISNFKTYAETADKQVAENIKTLAEPYVAQQSIFEKIGSVLYDVFVVGVGDILTDLGLGDIVQGARNFITGVAHWAEDVKDWFKYGDGQYIKNIISAAVEFAKGALLAIGIGILAIGAGPFMAVVAAVGVVAAGIYTATKFINFAVAYEYNTNAYEQSRKAANDPSKKGNRALAHYYGGVQSVPDMVRATDFGGQDANVAAEVVGKVYGVTERTSKFVADSAKAILTLYSFSNVYGPDGKTVVGHDGSRENIKNNYVRKREKILEGRGYDVDKTNHTYKQQGLVQFVFGDFGGDMEETLDKKGGGGLVLELFKEGGEGFTDRIDGEHGTVNQATQTQESLAELYEKPTFEGTVGAIDDMLDVLSIGPAEDVVDTFIKPFTTPFKDVADIMTFVKEDDFMTRPASNPYADAVRAGY